MARIPPSSRNVMLGPWVVALLVTAGGNEPIIDVPAVEPCSLAIDGMACVWGGWFERGNDASSRASPRERVWLQTFYMDVQEVTNAEYRACIQAGHCPPAGPRYADFDADEQPVHGVSWYDADQSCRALGKRLPTEAQWEKAARGVAGSRYPWGNEPATCERAVVRDRTGRGCGVQKRGLHPEVGKPWPVGSRPAGVYGLFDMAGNAYEWVADWASPSYAACGATCRGIDPRGPCEGETPCPGHSRKVVRGGSWYWPATHATAWHRRAHVPQNRPFHHFGFRCAASVAEAKKLAG